MWDGWNEIATGLAILLLFLVHQNFDKLKSRYEKEETTPIEMPVIEVVERKQRFKKSPDAIRNWLQEDVKEHGHAKSEYGPSIEVIRQQIVDCVMATGSEGDEVEAATMKFDLIKSIQRMSDSEVVDYFNENKVLMDSIL